MAIKLSRSDLSGGPGVHSGGAQNISGQNRASADGLEYVNLAIGQAEKRFMELFDEELSEPDISQDLTRKIVERFEQEHKVVLEQAPNEHARQTLQHKFSDIVERGMVRAVGAEHMQKVAARAESAEHTLSIYLDLVERDPDDAATYLEQGQQLLEDMRESGVHAGAIDRRSQEFRFEAVSAAFNGLVRRDAQEAFHRFESGEFDELFEDDKMKDEVRSKLQKVMEADFVDQQIQAEQVEQLKSQEWEGKRLRFEAELDQKLATGQAQQQDIAQAFWQGDIDEADADHLLRKIKAKADGDWAKQEHINRIVEVLEGSATLDLADPSSAGSVDVYYENVVQPQLQEIAPETRIYLEDLFIKRVGVFPSEVIKPIRGALLAGEPDEQVGAVMRLRSILASAPEIAEDLGHHLKPFEMAKAQAIAEYADLSIPADKVVPLALREVEEDVGSGILSRTIPDQPDASVVQPTSDYS